MGNTHNNKETVKRNEQLCSKSVSGKMLSSVVRQCSIQHQKEGKNAMSYKTTNVK
jgi:hypothetical protein